MENIPRPLKNVPISMVEQELANALNRVTGYNFRVIIKDINFETGETILEVHVVDEGEDSAILV